MELQTSYFIRTHTLLADGARVVVGFSGGVDSCVLLTILHRLGYQCVAVHCNFHLRGKESDRDAKFAEEFANSLKIPFHKADFDTIKFADDRKISVEMAARELRYDFFEQIRQSLNADAIAVGHHRDDSIETVLLNLIRGTGIRGLTGIKPRNGFIIRPLLNFTQEEILKYAQENNIEHITDSSNLTTDYTRNKIRLNLLPMLETINPSARESIAATMNNLSETESLYSAVIEENKSKIFDSETGIIDIPKLKNVKLPESTLYEILKEFGCNRKTVADVFLSLDSQSGKTFYSSGYCITKDRNTLIISEIKNKLQEEVYYISDDVTFIEKPFQMKISSQEITSDRVIDSNPDTATLDYDKLKFPLQLRHWRAGDRFMPFGMNNFQKLSDFFNNNKISRPEKEKIWLLTSDDEIVWIVGKRPDNRYKIEKNTKKALILQKK